MDRRSFAAAGLVLADGLVLACARRCASAAAACVTAPHAEFARAGTDAALAGLAAAALWLLAAWLGIGLLAAGAARLPGTLGRAGAALSRTLLPRVVLRLVAGSAGLGIVLAPALANATPPAPRPPAAVLDVPAPRWPLDTGTAPAVPEAAPVPVWPAAGPGRHSAGPGRHGTTVRVRPGDSLWLLAARHLGSDATPTQIASQWPRWYAANRDVIGRDPTLIRPGQLLRAPADARPGAGR